MSPDASLSEAVLCGIHSESLPILGHYGWLHGSCDYPGLRRRVCLGQQGSHPHASSIEVRDRASGLHALGLTTCCAVCRPTHPHWSSLGAVSLPGVQACPAGGHKRWGTAPPDMGRRTSARPTPGLCWIAGLARYAPIMVVPPEIAKPLDS